MSTAKENITVIRSGSLDSRIFLSISVSVGLYLAFLHDWTPLEAIRIRIRIQSPITFIQPDQPGLSIASIAAGAKPDTIRIATAAQFDLRAIAAAEKIELSPDDLTLDQARQQYIQKYGSLAVAEMKKYHIPASITLAQGLLETRAGQSGLAKKNNNHFGMKCFSRSCKKGHCSNFTDDTHKDFFLKFPSAWASYRAHSKLLRSGRYKNIRGDYRQWAQGLEDAGYATVRNEHGEKIYAESLIRLIRLYGLDRLDDI